MPLLRCRRMGIRLFGHARLAQALADPFVLLPVLRARQCEGNRRKATECRYPRVGISLQVGGERGSRLVGASCPQGGRKGLSDEEGVDRAVI